MIKINKDIPKGYYETIDGGRVKRYYVKNRIVSMLNRKAKRGGIPLGLTITNIQSRLKRHAQKKVSFTKEEIRSLMEDKIKNRRYGKGFVTKIRSGNRIYYYLEDRYHIKKEI